MARVRKMGNTHVYQRSFLSIPDFAPAEWKKFVVCEPYTAENKRRTHSPTK